MLRWVATASWIRLTHVSASQTPSSDDNRVAEPVPYGWRAVQIRACYTKLRDDGHLRTVVMGTERQITDCGPLLPPQTGRKNGGVLDLVDHVHNGVEWWSIRGGFRSVNIVVDGSRNPDEGRQVFPVRESLGRPSPITITLYC